MEKTSFELAGVPVQAEVSKLRQLAVHRALGARKGWLVTEIATGRLVFGCRLKGQAVRALKTLEALDWADARVVQATIDGGGLGVAPSSPRKQNACDRTPDGRPAGEAGP